MNEWTEQEEQQIIERAKTGDPEANYALSLWALHRGEEEPDEPRWNRLAAKCLVKAAQAGYGPAKEQMAALLGGQAPSPARQSAPPAEPEPVRQPAAAPVQDPDDVDDSDVKRAAPIRRSSAPRPTASVRRPAPRRRQEPDGADEGFDVDQASWDDGQEDEEDGRPVRKGRRGGIAPARRNSEKADAGRTRWADDKWRRMEFICVLVCAVLLVVIAVMLLSGRNGGGSGSGGNAAIPPAGEVGAAGGGNTVSDYPDEATKNAIMAADLDIFPAQEDFETQLKTGTVSVSSEYLRVRKGPNTTYDPIAQLPNESSVTILAKKNDWDLILYQGDDGPVYGWCSSGYIIELAGAAANGAAGADAAAAGDSGSAEG